MLNQIFELLYASLRALFRSDSLSKDNIAPKSRQNPDLRVSVEDPSDVRWDTTPSMSQKSSHSVSNGSIGGQNGHQHMMVEPNKPPLKPHMQNDCEKLVQQTQLITDLSDLDDTVTKSTMVPGSGGTMDDQSLPVRPEVMVQSTVVPLEDDQESAVKQDVLGSQFGMKQEQEDAARRYQIIDEHASYPDLHASIPSHRHLGEPPMMVSQRIYVDGSSANGTLAVPTSLYPRTPTPPRAFTMGQEPHSNHDCSFTDEDMVRLSQALVSHPQYPYYTCGWMVGQATCNSLVQGPQLSEHLRTRHGVGGPEKARLKCCWVDCFAEVKRESLIRHVKEVHLELRYPCPHCREQFTRRYTMQTHMSRKHPCS